LPSLLVEIADNQRGVIAALARAGAAVGLGAAAKADSGAIAEMLGTLLADSKRRVQMAAAGASLVDGRGAERILLAAIGSVQTKAGEVTLRLAEADDEGWLLTLQHKPETRRYFLNPEIPTSEEHRRFMQRMLNEPDTLLAIAECDGAAVGMGRLDGPVKEETVPHYRVSIAIDPDKQGQGIGLAVLSLLRRLAPGASLDAIVLPQNEASIRLFRRAGYVYVANDLYRSVPE
jgi:RimJ/RimL family protein N-acetyltransferase